MGSLMKRNQISFKKNYQLGLSVFWPCLNAPPNDGDLLYKSVECITYQRFVMSPRRYGPMPEQATPVSQINLMSQILVKCMRVSL